MCGRVEFVREIGDELSAAASVASAASTVATASALSGGKAASARFTICGHAKRIDCMVDGDTARMAGTKIHIADIDTPETHPPPLRSPSPPGAGGDAEDAGAAQRRLLHADPDQARRRPLRPEATHRRALRGIAGGRTGPSRTRAALWPRQAIALVIAGTSCHWS